MTQGDGMRDKADEPESGFFRTMGKFIGGALIGGLISLGIFLVATWLDAEAATNTIGICILWIIPLVWGMMGILFFDEMLDITKKVIAVILDIFDWA